MKTLFVLRHAKAENPAPGIADIGRGLNERGKNEAGALGAFIKKQSLTFDLVLCSTATRARETAELVLAAAESTASVRYDLKIYEAGATQLLEVIAKLEADANVVLLVGHNPGMAELLQLLTGRIEQMSTSALAKIGLEIDEWSKVLGDTRATGSLDWIVKPNDLGSR